MKKTAVANTLLIAFLLVTAAVSWLVIQKSAKPGSFVTVQVNGSEAARFSLSENGTYSLNGGSNILVIEDGQAWISDADCPDRLCISFGRISKSGQTIICLPNKLVVQVAGTAGSGSVSGGEDLVI